MSTANAQSISGGDPSSGDGDWLGWIGQAVGGFIRGNNGGVPVWGTAGSNGDPNGNQPTYGGTSTNNTGTGSGLATVESLLPILLIGGAVIAAIVLLKK